MPTLAEIRAAVLRNLDRASVAATESTDVDTWINGVIREDLCQEHSWSFMEASSSATTVTSVATVAQPTSCKDIDFLRFRKVATDEWATLEEISYQSLLEEFSEITKGVPRAWARRGAVVHLRPIPEVTGWLLDFTFWQYQPTLTANQTNDILTEYPRLVEIAATVRGLLQYGEEQRATVWQQLYEQHKARCVKCDRNRLAPSDLHLNISLDSGKRASGLKKSSGNAKRTAFYTAQNPLSP